MKMKKVLVILLALVMMFTMAACGGGDSGGGDEASAASSAASIGTDAGDKDTIVILTSQNWQATFNPTQHTTIIGARGEQLALDRLMEYNQETDKIEPSLATEWKYNDDGTVLNVKLLEGVKFHDGSDFDADDVVASLPYYSSPDNPTATWFTEQLAVEKVGPYEVNVSTVSKSKCAGLINMLAFAPIMSADDIADPENTLNLRYNGTGKYKFVKYEDECVYFTVNEDYRGDIPQIKNIEYKYVADATSRLSALQSGQADIVERLESDMVSVVDADENCVIYEHPTSEVQHLGLKGNVDPMGNKLIRQAIAYAIDRETIVNDIFNGYAQLATNFVAPGTWGYFDAELPEYNPDKAKELLAEAGYPDGQGLPTLKYVTGVGFYQKTKEVGAFITANLQAVGFQVDFEPMESSAWIDIYDDVDGYHMTQCGWMTPGIETDLKIVPFYLNGILSGQYTTDAVKEAINEFDTETNEEARRALYRDKVVPALIDDMIDVPLYYTVDLYGMSSKIHDVGINGFGVYDFTKTTKD
ncbi:MAG: ABC transporter substrate-binding protein [Eubacterium sp.]|nr:ABC transporter substrate-binding protein [Eubacterium sp.]